MSGLASRICVPCQGGVPPLTADEIAPLLAQLPDGWTCVDGHHLRKQFAFPDFVTGLEFVNRVAGLAEAVGHHPDLLLSWGKVVFTVWTHKIDGLAEADFVFAAKAEQLLAS